MHLSLLKAASGKNRVGLHHVFSTTHHSQGSGFEEVWVLVGFSFRCLEDLVSKDPSREKIRDKRWEARGIMREVE